MLKKEKLLRLQMTKHLKQDVFLDSFFVPSQSDYRKELIISYQDQIELLFLFCIKK